mgnify:CR=1 FL=1
MIGFKYPKLMIFALLILAAYILFRNETVAGYFSQLGSLGYLSMFIAGVLFAFGFTSPFAVGMFIVINPQNILFAALIGGFGSMLANVLVFNLIKSSFTEELKELEKTKFVKGVEHAFELRPHHKIGHYLLYVFAGLVLASPLPDEISVVMLAGLTHIKESLFILVSFILHTLGIYLLLLI